MDACLFSVHSFFARTEQASALKHRVFTHGGRGVPSSLTGVDHSMSPSRCFPGTLA